jgi:thymidine phosphorylase
MDTVPITLTGTPEQIRALHDQFTKEGLTAQQVSATKLTVYVTLMSKDEAFEVLANNR